MSEYTFDASLTVDADDFADIDEASNYILETLLDGNIAGFVCKDGTMYTEEARKEINRLKEIEKKYYRLVAAHNMTIEVEHE